MHKQGVGLLSRCLFWLGLVSSTGYSTHDASGMDPVRFEQDCRHLLHDVPVALLLHDSTSVQFTLAQLKDLEFRATALAAQHASQNTVPIVLPNPLRVALGVPSVSTHVLMSTARAIRSARWLLYVEADLSAEYELWVGSVALRTEARPRSFKEFLSNAPLEPAPVELQKKYAPRSTDSWANEGVAAAYVQISSDALVRSKVGSARYSDTQIAHLESFWEEHSAHIPLSALLGPILRTHAHIVDHYHLDRSPLFYDVLRQFEQIHLQAIGH